MGVTIIDTGAGARLEPSEVKLLAAAARARGHVTVLVPSFVERDALRRDMADAGVGLGIEVTTPSAWIVGLWGLFGDGRRLVGEFERRAVIASILDERAAESIAPLRNNPGTVRLLARTVRDLAPYADTRRSDGERPLAGADDMVFGLMAAYRAAISARGLVETSEAAELMASEFASRCPACLGAVVVRDVTTAPAYLLRLLSAAARCGVRGAGDACPAESDGAGGEGELAWLLGSGQEGFAPAVAAEFKRMRCRLEHKELVSGIVCTSCDAPVPTPEFVEVAGPHAKVRAYASEALRLLEADAATEGADAPASARADSGQTPQPVVVVAHPQPAGTFFELAPRLSRAGAVCSARVSLSWNESMAGKQFMALVGLAARMEAAGADPLRAGEWWPAPELSDWLRCPLSGVDASYALEFDEGIRTHRSYTVEQVDSELQRIQDEQQAVRARLDPSHPYAHVDAACATVWKAICHGQPVRALEAMLALAEALPASAFGGCEGQARQRVERALLEAAVEALDEHATELGVSQRVAATALDALRVSLSLESELAGPVRAGGHASGQEPRRLGRIRFVNPDEVAFLPRGSVRGLLLLDCDAETYALKHDEDIETMLAERLGCPTLAMEPAMRLRTQFARAVHASAQPAVLARVTHDGQANDRYPAVMWTELHKDAGVLRAYDEADIVCDLDSCSGAGMCTVSVGCLPAQALSDAAVPYTVLKVRDQKTGSLRPRRLSASQIESYCTCPLCWFVSSRIRPRPLDASFGSIEEGNFVHDVMERFHEHLRERGLGRPLPGNVPVCHDVLDEAFDETRAAHAHSSTPGRFVAHSPLEAARLEVVRNHLQAAVSYEASALVGFVPTRFECSFDELDATYAGRPLGGRIDRVDEDAAGAAVVIDYKHRSDDQFKISDPTAPPAGRSRGKKAAPAPAGPLEVAAEWLPKHTQALVYAQVLERTGEANEVRGALYFLTKGAHPGMKGAVSGELVSQVPGLEGRDAGSGGFPGIGGSWSFQDLLDHVEAAIALRLDEMDVGNVAAAAERARSCVYNHPLRFGKRGA